MRVTLMADMMGSYYGLNDFDERWVAESNWTYSTTITGL